MSFDAVFDGYKRTEDHIKKQNIMTPYSFIKDAKEKVKDLFIKWLEVYKEYARGYSQELLTRSKIPTIRLLSTYGVVLEQKFSEIFDARILDEAYILLNDFFNTLNCPSIFVVAEANSFKNTSIYAEVQKALNGLSLPAAIEFPSKLDVLLEEIQRYNAFIINYERGQYDNVLSWPLLLHEAIHCIYSSTELQNFEKNYSDVPWCREALIDIYITNFFGPSYATALANYLQRFPYTEAASHPDFCARLYISLLYLTELTKDEESSIQPIKNKINEAFDYVKKIWEQHRQNAPPDVQDKAGEIYEATRHQIKNSIMRKNVKPFQGHFVDVEGKRRNFLKSKELNPVLQILSIDDVLFYYDHGIPISADPRILFNAFISKRFQESITAATNIFITQSLKKWHICKTWSRAEKEVS